MFNMIIVVSIRSVAKLGAFILLDCHANPNNDKNYILNKAINLLVIG